MSAVPGRRAGGFLVRKMGSEMKLTICVGDIHGHLDKLKKLWKNLEFSIGSPAFGESTVIFWEITMTGDLIPEEFWTSLISLATSYPSQKHVFLIGNHDFAFMACLGILPSPPPGVSFSSTWKEYIQNEAKEGWWSGKGQEDVHVQGRRWAGIVKATMNPAKGVPYQGSIYDAEPTFNSYGVALGDREGLIANVPAHHKQFLRNLLWVYEQEATETGNPETSYSKLIAVHGGLEKGKPVQDQLAPLYHKDASIPRLETLYGRKNVWDIPEELATERVLLVSGHHGALHVDKLRLIIDESGGLGNRPLAAIILPSRIIVRDTDDITVDTTK